ncbi:MAG: alpha-amylase/4-alpha-glucanotransferase domain-containing protein [Dehalococcoidia bacterium]
MPGINLGLILHNHQPVGQLPWVFEQIYDESYLPMLEALEANPHVRLSLHYTGCLLDWIVPNRPDFVPRLRALVERGQVEVLTGGYYEPILVSIPEDDAIGQIRKLTGAVHNLFGQEASGLWLAERVWEPHLPRILALAGVDWTVLDDTHFKLSGLTDEDLRGYYVTEDRGAAVKVLATSKRLRELIPWHDPQEVIDYLRARASEEPALLVMGDDGEKFGSWPGTHEYVWKKGWMSRFFAAVKENQDWLTTVPVGEYVKSHPSLGRVYMPTASYEEMMEWALPAPRSHRLGVLRKELAETTDGLEITGFMAGGLWRNFLAKYPEVNTLHKKVLRVHDKLASAEASMQRGRQLEGLRSVGPVGGGPLRRWRDLPKLDIGDPLRAPQHELSEAWDHLWAAECNCPYWHGVFGGIYLRDIRHALFSHAIEAEVAADGLRREPWFEASAEDHDRDGNDELLLESESSDVYLSLSRGAGIFDWDIKQAAAETSPPGPSPRRVASGDLSRRGDGEATSSLAPFHPINLATAMTRRPEAYHETLRATLATPPVQAGGDSPVESIHDAVVVLDEDIAGALVYDWHDRWCAVEHFFDRATTIEQFARAEYSDLGDFTLHEFGWENSGERAVALQRDGTVRAGQAESRVLLRKELTMGTAGELAVSYALSHLGGDPIDCRFGSEWNLSPILFGNVYEPQVLVNGEPIEWSQGELLDRASVASLEASAAGIALNLAASLTPPASLWSTPVEVASASEKGFERTYQGQCLYFQWPLKLAPGEEAKFDLSWTPRAL